MRGETAGKNGPPKGVRPLLERPTGLNQYETNLCPKQAQKRPIRKNL